ncbi:MAG: aminotransferase class I/II-fold pyridoxal phosphate-dependent enzyme [Candidatus Micrarchaeota archaeon]
MKTASRLNNVTYAVRDVVVAAQKLEAQGKKILKLNIGDPCAYDFDTPQYLKDALVKAVNEGHNGYSDSQGFIGLRQAVCENNKKKGFESQPEDVVVSNGLSEACHLLFGALLDSGDNVLLPSPDYPLYSAFANYYGAEPRYYNLDEENDWAPNWDDLRAKTDARTRAMVLINPGNPTGAVYGAKTVKKAIDFAGEHDIPLLSDEIYDDFIFEGSWTSTAALTSDVPVISMNGLSKNYFAPGWKIGWFSFQNFPDDDYKQAVLKIARTRLSSNNPCEHAAEAALRNENPEHAAAKQKLKRRRDLAFKLLNEINGVSCTKPRGAFYAFPRLDTNKWKSDKDFVMQLLEEKSVLTVFGEGFGQKPGTKHFRIVFLPDEQTLTQAIGKIKELVES